MMRLLASLFVIISFAAAGGGAWVLGLLASELIEEQTHDTVSAALSAAGQEWPEITADGTMVAITGQAPTEAAGFRALEVARGIVGAERLNNQIVMVAASTDVAPRDLGITLLFSADAITVLGNAPGTSLDVLAEFAEDSARPLNNLAQLVERPAPAAWTYNLRAALEAAPLVETGRVTFGPRGAAVIEAALQSSAQRAAIEEIVRASAPPGTAVSLELAAPPATLAPYPFSARKRSDGLTIETCAVPNDATLGRIAMAAGAGDANCVTALGAPQGWTAATSAVIEALLALPTGRATLESTLVQFEIGARTTQDLADQVTANLQAALPEGYTLVIEQRSLPNEVPNPRSATAPPPFSVERADGVIILRGALTDVSAVEAVLSYAESAFSGMTLDAEVETTQAPGTTTVASAIAALEAVTLLTEGAATAEDGALSITGQGLGEGLSEQMRDALATRLPERTEIEIEIEEIAIAQLIVEPEPEADPVACLADVQAIQTPSARIGFAPSSANLDLSSAPVLDALSARLRECPELNFIVAGYTDDQGREEMNQRISESRANAVLDALLARGVFLDRMRAVGLGEADPVADNETEEGRALNRRIEFLPADAIPPEPEDPPSDEEPAPEEATE